MTNNYNLKSQSEIKDFSDRIIELEDLYRRTRKENRVACVRNYPI